MERSPHPVAEPQATSKATPQDVVTGITQALVLIAGAATIVLVGIASMAVIFPVAKLCNLYDKYIRQQE